MLLLIKSQHSCYTNWEVRGKHAIGLRVAYTGCGRKMPQHLECDYTVTPAYLAETTP